MKTFTLTLMAAMLAFASTAMAQKKVVLTANDIQVANGEEAELVVSMNYETTEDVVGLNFSLYLPDGILLKGFDTKEAQDAGKASALKKACDLGDEGIWGEDAYDGWLSVKKQADGGLLFAFIDQDDKTPFESTKAPVITIKVHAVADVKGTGSIRAIALTNDEAVSLDLNNIEDVVFYVNTTVGINEMKWAEAAAPTYNLQGVRVSKAAKGLLIRDGKKKFVK